MSPFFISYIKQKTKCGSCTASPREGYSCCEKHLAYARNKWRGWAKLRRRQGLCISCPNHAWDGGDRLNSIGRRLVIKGRRLLRCKFHTMENRRKCAAWVAAHPGYSEREWEKRKKLIDAGVCPCAAKNRLTGGFRSCEACRKRKAAWDRTQRRR